VEFKSSENPFERKRRPNANWAGGGLNERERERRAKGKTRDRR